MSGTAPAVRVFISYSRKDASFVAHLTEALQAKGYDVFVDTEDISGGEEWKQRLDQLILSTDVVAFVISPDSVASKICDWEVERTLALGKRLIPMLWRPLDSLAPPSRLAERNYIFFDHPDRFESALTQLCNACDVDIGWVREHTRLIGLAERWHENGRARDGVLRGGDLKTAKLWMAARAPRAPEIPATFQEFVTASEREEKRARGNRFRVTAVLGVLAVLLVASVVGFATQNRWRPVVEAALGRYAYYDVLLPQTVGERIAVNSRVIFNGIDVGAVQALRLYPNDPRIMMARVVMSNTVPIREDSTVDIRPAQDGDGRLLIAIGAGSPEAPPLAGSDGQTPPPRLVALFGADAQAFMDRAAIYEHEDNRAPALADYGEAIRLNPQLAAAYYSRATIHSRANDTAAALADYDQAITLEPGNEKFLAAACSSRAGWSEAHLDQALAQCDAALQAQPDNVGTLESRGVLHLRRGAHQSAFNDFDAAVRADARFTDALYGRGLAQLRLGRIQAGQADIESATAQDQDVASRYAGYGLAP